MTDPIVSHFYYVYRNSFGHESLRATSGQEVLGSIPAPAPYWLGRCQYNVTGFDKSHGLSLCGST